MEHAFVSRQINTQKKIPELKDALRVVQLLEKRKVYICIYIYLFT